jgi:hypothetical protein
LAFIVISVMFGLPLPGWQKEDISIWEGGDISIWVLQAKVV